MSNGLRDIDNWQASLRGDQDAFGELFKNHYGLLFQYGTKLCSDYEVVEDCIQELFVELWQKRLHSDIVSVKAYLLQSLKFKLYKSFRSRRFSIDPESPQNNFFELSHETFVIRKETDFERTQSLFTAMAQLSSRQREVIYLKIYKGLSYEEVSSIMNISYQAVRNLVYQSLKQLRKLVIPVTVILAIIN